MMNNNHLSEKARIKNARYVSGARYQKKLEETFMHLPDKKKNTVTHKMWTSIAAAAALVLFLAVAAPSIVRAAGQVIDRLFGRMSEQDAVYLNMPEDDRVQYVLEQTEKYSRGHDVNASAEFGGMTLTLKRVSFSPDNPYDEGVKSGFMQGTIEFSETPAFNPNKMDFALKYDGREYVKKGTGADVLDEWESNTQMMGGVTETYFSFDVENWKLDAPTEITLTGTLNGETFEILFTFDPEKAHQEAIAQAEQDTEIYTRMSEERIEKFDALDKASGMVGIERDVDGFSFAITNIALTDDGNVNIGWAVYNVTEKNHKIASLSHSINELVVDGYPSPWAGGADDELTDGTLMLQEYKPLGYDARNLPEESLITMMLVKSGEKESDRVSTTIAFRYHWAEKKVTLPNDAAEEAEWIEENRKRREQIEASIPYETIYDLSQAELSKTVNGLTLTLKSLSLRDNNIMDLTVTFTSGPELEGVRLTDDWDSPATLSIDGGKATASFSSMADGRPTGMSFILPCHITEIKDGAQIQFAFTACVYENGRQADDDKYEFTFEFALDREKLNARDLTEEEAMAEYRE